MSSNRHRLSPHFVRFLQRNKVLQEKVVLLTVETRDEPRIPAAERVHAYSLAPNIMRVVLRYGFMQQPHVPIGLRVCRELGLDIELANITYYIGRETLIPSRIVAGMNIYRERIFAFLARNAMRPTTFYSLPVEDVIELGFQVEI
jgi:KUP system potassium uptake protein